ncbi:MAG: hypothetical protein JNL32_15850, partial [Candidatus Kapabacteria bacterium]|nr:hypothetical protein [Candidatus Kapabacteria bacterium]
MTITRTTVCGFHRRKQQQGYYPPTCSFAPRRVPLLPAAPALHQVAPQRDEYHMNITTHARRIAAISALFFISTLFVSAHEITLSGKVLGAGERPLRAGNVSIFRFGALEADTTVSIGNSGGYSLTFKASSGAVKVRFTGVHHEPLDVLVMSSKPMREQLDAQLTPQRFPSSPDSVVLLDQSNNYNISSGKKLEYKNGVYSAPMPDVQDEQYAYQIVPRYALQLRSEMIPFAGTVADTFEFDGVASYRAIFGTDKKSITFDAADIPRSNTSASFRFANPVLQQQATAYSMIAGFRRAFQDSTQRDAARQQQRGSAFNDMNLAEF